MHSIKNVQKSHLPRYRNLIQSIEESILKDHLSIGDRLPSLNMIKKQFNISRDTALVALTDLKNRGIVYSVAGKGYFVKSKSIDVKHKIFLLFDELNAFKEDLYESFINQLPVNTQVDIFFHHFNFKLFSKLIADNNGNYTHYVVMPADLKNTSEVLMNLPEDRVIILDQLPEDLKAYPAIYQDFEQDMFNCLMALRDSLEKYQKLVLLFPKSRQPIGMLLGFQKFEKRVKMNTQVIATIDELEIEPKTVYILLDDEHLIKTIKKNKSTPYNIGRDVGIISYNDTMLKEVIEDGITTISTDFKLMGKHLANMILNNQKEQIKNQNKMILRPSL